MPPETPAANPVSDNNTPTCECNAWYSPLWQVTPTSKVLAAVVMVVLPFVGLYIGYKMSPEKIIEVPVQSDVNVKESSGSVATADPDWLTADLKDMTELKVNASTTYTFAAYIQDLDLKNKVIKVNPVKLITHTSEENAPYLEKIVSSTILSFPTAERTDYPTVFTDLSSYIFTWYGTQQLHDPSGDAGSYMVDFDEARRITSNVDENGKYIGYVRYITVSQEGRVIQIDTQFEP